MVNKVRVNIAGTPYAIATTDSEKYILGLAKKLDEDITKLLDTNDNLSVTKAAVFCAMDYLDEYRKSTGSAENMRSQIQDYIADAARAKLAEDKALAGKRRAAPGSCRPAGAAGQGAPARDPPGGARRPRCGRDCTGAGPPPEAPGGRQCADRRDQLNVPYINRSQKENYGKDRNLSPSGQ